jgi:CO/xanthine dehydrogenase FAD-binding subunit
MEGPDGRGEAAASVVDILRPRDLAEALALRAEHPDAVPLAGGTDLMVDLNFDRRRPARILDLTGVSELRRTGRENGRLRLGAGVTYTELGRLAPDVPGLALAARTVGSPQIRNRGTVGGNLGSASPAGDCHPPLLACGAEIELASVRGTRRMAAERFFTGVKRSALAPDELVRAIHLPVARGPQQFCKVGPRNAMVIAVCSLAVSIDREAGTVGTGIGSAAPTPVRAPEAEAFLAGSLAEDGRFASGGPLRPSELQRFGELVAAAASPIDDVRGSAAYRRHALSVLARRALCWCWEAAA